MTDSPHSTKPRDLLPRNLRDSDLPLLLHCDFMEVPGAVWGQVDIAAEARREERLRAVLADLDRQSDDRAREFRARQAAERQAAASVKPTRKPRRPSISKMIAQAEKATGKPVTAITMPDGTKLDFSKPESVEPENPWPLDEFRTKETMQ
jgi:hypothetical protein